MTKQQNYINIHIKGFDDMNNKSFTLIEFVVAITIMIVIATIGTAKFYSFDTLKLDAAAQKVASDIRYAQSLAMNFSPGSRYCQDENGDWNCASQYREFYGCAAMEFFDKDHYYNSNVNNKNSYMILPCILPAIECNGFSPSTVSYAPVEDPFTKTAHEVHLNTEFPGVTIENISFTTLGYTLIAFEGKYGSAGAGYWFCFSFPNARTYAAETLNTTTWSYGSYTFSGGYITLGYKGKIKIIRIADVTGRVMVCNNLQCN